MIRLYYGTIGCCCVFELGKNTISSSNNNGISNNKEFVGSNSIQTNSGDKDKQKDEESSRQLKEKYVK